MKNLGRAKLPLSRDEAPIPARPEPRRGAFSNKPSRNRLWASASTGTDREHDIRDYLVSITNILNKDYYGQFASFSFSAVENLQAARGRSRPEDSSGELQEFRSYRIWGGLGKDSPGEMLVISEVSMRRLYLPRGGNPGRCPGFPDKKPSSSILQLLLLTSLLQLLRA